MPYTATYRDFEIRLSKNRLGEFLQALAIANGSIVGTSFLRNTFSAARVGLWTGLFMLRFETEADMIRFHELGYMTEEPPVISGQASSEAEGEAWILEPDAESQKRCLEDTFPGTYQAENLPSDDEFLNSFE